MQHHENGTVAQSVEQRTFNPLVASSNLARPTIFIRFLCVALYIAQLTKSRLKSSSIRIAVASISSIHKLNCLSDPAQHPDVKIELRRMHRTIGRSCQQAFGITAPILERMLAATNNNLRGGSGSSFTTTCI